MKKRISRILLLLMAVVVVTGMSFGGTGAACSYAAETETQMPSVIVTGTGVVGESYNSAEDLAKETSYTLEELKSQFSAEKHLYSTRNNVGTKNFYKTEGADLMDILDGVDFQANKVSVIANDGFAVVFDPEQDAPTPDGEPGAASPIAPALDTPRYYFPHIVNDSEEDKVEVATMISWASSSKYNATMGDVPQDTDITEYGNGQVRLTAGQAVVKESNNQLWNGETPCFKIVVGEELPAIVNLNGKDYSRADLLGRSSVTKAYTYNEQTEYAKGVPAADFFSAFEPEEKIAFTCSDGSQGITLTKQDLEDKNCILAYAKGSSQDNLTGIFDKSGDTKGYLTLYGDGMEPVSFIEKAVFQEESTEPPEPTDPSEPTEPSEPTAPVKEAAAQKITAKSFKKTYGNKAFNIGAKAKTKLSYKSSNRNVATVSSTGRVTLKGPGKATITITAAATSDYKAATKKITVTVSPKKMVLKKAKSTKNRTLKVSWKRDKKATGYQVVVAQKKNFKKGKKSALVRKNKTTSKTFKKLKSKKTYYYKVRAYKNVNGKKLYGAYSKTKRIKVK